MMQDTCSTVEVNRMCLCAGPRITGFSAGLYVQYMGFSNPAVLLPFSSVGADSRILKLCTFAQYVRPVITSLRIVCISLSVSGQKNCLGLNTLLRCPTYMYGCSSAQKKKNQEQT
jgi:hypothetical protein